MHVHVRVTVAAVVALLAAGCGDAPSGPAVPTIDVFTPGEIFSPPSATVPAGGIVRYNIFGFEHDVIFSHAVPGYPADIPAVRDTIVSRTFPTKGTFTYVCMVHPGMNGEIVVQ